MKSLLHILLPDDEYKRIRILYFMAEGMFLNTTFLIIFVFINKVWLQIEFSDVGFFAFIIAMSNLLYILIRYLLSGIEYTDVFSEESYKQERKKIVRNAGIFGGIFLIISGIQIGIPSSLEAVLDLVVPTIFGVFFYFLIGFISLKRSYAKNKQLLGK